MKAALQLRTSQQLTLTPQLQQAIRLLQLSTQEVQAEVARLLDENPLLEIDEEVAPGISGGEAGRAHESAQEAPARDSDEHNAELPDWSGSNARSDEDDSRFPEQAAEAPGLREHLLLQLAVSSTEANDQKIVRLLIETLDENGYLGQDLAELATLLENTGIGPDELETALVQLQHLDRPGIGARSLAECLTLQLRALPEDTPARSLALRLVAEHLELLAHHDFARLQKLLHCSTDELRAAQQLVLGLNPRPGMAFDHSVADYVIPDVIVEKHRKGWHARLNPDAMPRLRVNQMYASILQQREEKDATGMTQQLQEAKWLVKNLQQRFETILRVAQAIVDRQSNFFEHGEIGLRPLVLREIAEELELHESTVSRSTTQKFMQTPHGVLEFKHFFGSGLATENGGTCSAAAIRELIRQMVGAEDRRKPLTDSRMSEILAQQGIVVARRTVAKYREALHILPVNLRKSL
ncbi:MAG: RNA polymerase factor sigma-54 [Gallionella sp.]|nr:RNA polymerase factor sigma-54 [Gallionella sp.]